MKPTITGTRCESDSTWPARISTRTIVHSPPTTASTTVLGRALLHARRQRLGPQEDREDIEHRLGPIERVGPRRGQLEEGQRSEQRLIGEALKQLSERYIPPTPAYILRQDEQALG